jgi:hypothetical protein
MPFTSALTITSTLFPSIILGALLLLIMLRKLFSGHIPIVAKYNSADLILLTLFLCCVAASYLTNGLGNSKSLNHTIAYFSSFLIYYVSIRFSMINSERKEILFKKILLSLTIVCLFSSLYAITEFTLKNLGWEGFDALLPRANVERLEYDPLILGMFIRARGFAAESGHFMFMMELLSPITLYYLFFSNLSGLHKLLKVLIAALIFISMLFTGSIAGFLIIPTAFIITFLLRFNKSKLAFKHHKRNIIIRSISLLSIVLLINVYIPINDMINLAIEQKLDSSSRDDREQRNDFFFIEFPKLPLAKNIIGAGPAGTQIMGYSSGGSILTLYLSVCFELGVLGCLVFLLFMGIFYFMSISMKGNFGFFLTYSLVAGSLHYLIVANYYYPWFWFICALTFFYRSLEIDNAKSNSYSPNI